MRRTYSSIWWLGKEGAMSDAFEQCSAIGIRVRDGQRGASITLPEMWVFDALGGDGRSFQLYIKDEQGKIRALVGEAIDTDSPRRRVLTFIATISPT